MGGRKALRDTWMAFASGRVREFSRISRAQRTSSPVLIVGAARSGTTLLYRMIQHHPAFILRPPDAPASVNLVESWIVPFLYGPELPGSLGGWHGEAFMLFDPTCWERFSEALRATSIFRGIARRAPGSWRNTGLWSRLTSRDDLLRLFMHYARLARHCHRLVEKTPMAIPYVADIHRALPNAKMLFVARHPIDVLTSYRRRVEYDPNARWAEVTIDAFCDRYAAEARAALTFARSRPDRLMVVGYNELTSAPEETSRAVCAYLDEPFDSSMLDLTDETRERAIDPLHRDEIVKRTKDWRDYMSDDEADVLEQRLAEPMLELSFVPYVRSAG